MNRTTEIRIDMRAENGMCSGSIHEQGDTVTVAACMLRAMLSLAEEVETENPGDGKVFLGTVGMELLERAMNKPKGGTDDGTDQT